MTYYLDFKPLDGMVGLPLTSREQLTWARSESPPSQPFFTFVNESRAF